MNWPPKLSCNGGFSPELADLWKCRWNSTFTVANASCTDIARLANALSATPTRSHPELDNRLDQLRILQARFLGCLCEVFVGREMRVRVRLDEVNFIVRRQSQLDPRVTV